MENEIQPTQVITPPVLSPNKSKKTLLLILLGFVLITTSVYVGIQIGKKQVPSQQSTVIQLTAEPTQVIVDSTDSSENSETDTTSTNLTKNWKTYSDKRSRISFLYPDNILLNSEQKNTDKLSLWINIKDLDNYIDEPLGYDLETAIKDKKALDQGNLINQSETLVKIDSSIYGRTSISFRLLEICDVRFHRNLIFYHNNQQIAITLSGPRDTFIQQMPEYFTKDPQNCSDFPIWKSEEKFHNDLIENKAPSAALQWYNLFDTIISTIKLDK